MDDVTVVFSDIVGSSEALEILGDHGWLRILRAHNALVRSCVADHGGTVVKTAGDGFLLLFRDPVTALRCAIAIELGVAEVAASLPEHPVAVRIGVHAGPVLRDDDDLVGKTVHVAARVMGHARAGEILASDVVQDLTRGRGFAFGADQLVSLRGFGGTHRLVPVDWAAAAAHG